MHVDVNRVGHRLHNGPIFAFNYYLPRQTMQSFFHQSCRAYSDEFADRTPENSRATRKLNINFLL